jgi:hypothetical protein
LYAVYRHTLYNCGVEIFKKYPEYAITVICSKIKMNVVVSVSGFLSFISCMHVLILVPAQSEAWVCSHMLAVIAGLNHTGAWMSFLLSVVR